MWESLSMPRPKSSPRTLPQPVKNIGTLLEARAQIMRAFPDQVLKSVGLSLEMAEILVELRNAVEFSNWRPQADEAGYLTRKQLQEARVHDASLLTRRLTGLEELGLLEIKKAKEVPGSDPNLHGNTLLIRLTAVGKKRIRPVWDRYEAFCNSLTEGIPATKLAAHEAVNREISAKLTDLLG